MVLTKTAKLQIFSNFYFYKKTLWYLQKRQNYKFFQIFIFIKKPYGISKNGKITNFFILNFYRIIK